MDCLNHFITRYAVNEISEEMNTLSGEEHQYYSIYSCSKFRLWFEAVPALSYFNKFIPLLHVLASLFTTFFLRNFKIW